jgi:hypothetical protein
MRRCYTHSTEDDPDPGAVIDRRWGGREVDTRRLRAHLTVGLGYDADSNHISDHGHQRGEARKRINLPKEKISQWFTSRRRQ